MQLLTLSVAIFLLSACSKPPDDTRILSWGPHFYELRSPKPPRSWSIDYTNFESFLGAAFTTITPPLYHGSPKLLAAVFVFDSVPVAMTKPVIERQSNIIMVSYALRKPPDYGRDDDVLLDLQYSLQGEFRSVVFHGAKIDLPYKPYQYFTQAQMADPIAEVAHEVKKQVLPRVDSIDSPYFHVAPILIEKSLIAIDKVMLENRSANQAVQ